MHQLLPLDSKPALLPRLEHRPRANLQHAALARTDAVAGGRFRLAGHVMESTLKMAAGLLPFDLVGLLGEIFAIDELTFWQW